MIETGEQEVGSPQNLVLEEVGGVSEELGAAPEAWEAQLPRWNLRTWRRGEGSVLSFLAQASILETLSDAPRVGTCVPRESFPYSFASFNSRSSFLLAPWGLCGWGSSIFILRSLPSELQCPALLSLQSKSLPPPKHPRLAIEPWAWRAFLQHGSSV